VPSYVTYWPTAYGTPGAHAGAVVQSLVVPELLPVAPEELLDSPLEELLEEPPDELEEVPPELPVSVPEELDELPVPPLLVDPDPVPLPLLELLLEDCSL
jgi:hypothetical protein